MLCIQKSANFLFSTWCVESGITRCIAGFCIARLQRPCKIHSCLHHGVPLYYCNQIDGLKPLTYTTCGTAVKGNHRFDINLEQKTCSCRRHQYTGVPCSHACAVIRAIGKAPRDFMPDYLTRHHWVNTYSKNMRPLDRASIFKLKKDHAEKMKSLYWGIVSYLLIHQCIFGKIRTQRVKTRMTLMTLDWAWKLHSASYC